LNERKEKVEKAKIELEKAREEGDAEMEKKLSKRTIRVTKEQADECKKLLKLMGIPIVEVWCCCFIDDVVRHLLKQKLNVLNCVKQDWYME
jgi:5'-3' exonuclease